MSSVPDKAVPALDAQHATRLRAVPVGSYRTASSLRLLGAGSGVTWFSESKADGSTTLLEIAPWPLSNVDEEGGDPVEQAELASASDRSLFRRDIHSFPVTSRILAGVSSSGAIGIIESRARGGGGLVDWTPSRYHLYHSSGEKGIEVALDWPSVTVHSVAIKPDANLAPILSTTVAGRQKLGASEIVAPRGGRVHTVIQLDVDGSIRWATPIEDLEAGGEAFIGADFDFIALLSTARDTYGSTVLVSVEAGAGAIRWARTIRSRRDGEPDLEPGMLKAPSAHSKGMVLTGFLTGLDFGDGALSSDLSESVVSLDDSGNFSWARSVDERILAVSTDTGDIRLLTQNPRTGDAVFYALDADGSVTSTAGIPWPEECGTETVLAWEAAALYTDRAQAPVAVIQCSTYGNDERRSTQLFVYRLIP